MLNIAVLVSGGGTNLQALIDSERNGEIKNGKIVRVISSKADAYAIERAKKVGIPAVVVERKKYENSQQYDEAILSALEESKADLVVLAGFMSILGASVIRKYENKIINIHPALIPSFCGKGFYGLKVHEAALEKGVKVTGATVHFVNEIADDGAIILQECIKVNDDDTPQTLQRRVMENIEWKILPKAVSLFCEGKIEVVGSKTKIKE
ncbi:MAG: phosphoribosylglycinamide formyltransferase [Clostridiales bacterium]|nr:phosphoribosylglycinamide formyltransferase [Clostridiales bacterium]